MTNGERVKIWAFWIVVVGLVVFGIGKFGPKIQEAAHQAQVQAEESLVYPEPTNYAVDITGEIHPRDLEKLNTKLKGLDNGKYQFGVAVVKTTYPLTIEQYGIRLAEKWKVGKAGLDNGAIIILATQDRKVRIEVGYGLEGNIPDAVAGRVIDVSMIPFLKSSDWFGALNSGIEALSVLAE